MSAHTPGPWVQRASKLKTHYIVETISHGQKRHVAECHIWVDEQFGPLVHESVANASLIAAAPELLAALKNALSNAPIPHDGVDPKWVQDAEAAIAKATGVP